MQKIGHSTPTANDAGEFSEGNPAAGVDPTWLTAEWHNTVQRELVAVVEAGGFDLDQNDDAQLQKSISAQIGSAVSPATQVDAEAGTNNSRPMTALRVFQAIAKKIVQATESVMGIAKIATQAQADAGTDDATIITPKKLRMGFAYVLGNTGYIALPSWLAGWVIQWGYTTVSGSTTSVVATLPFVFPTNNLGGVASDSGATCWPAGIASTSRTQITLYVSAYSVASGAVTAKNASANIRWIVCGN